jgi:hypothetical protein
MKTRPWILWFVAAVLTLVTGIYQRRTGPTYPMRGAVSVGGQPIQFSLPRAYDGPDDAEVRIPAPAPSMTGLLLLRRFRSNDVWSTQPMSRAGDSLVGHIPHQPVAGKVMYSVVLQDGGDQKPLTSEPCIIRFRNPVPLPVVIPHVSLMFIALLLSTRAGLEDLIRGTRTYRFTLWAVITLAVGGVVLGPIMQKYAFDAYWTGWPLGHDLTDNKTAAALLVWLVALWRMSKKTDARGWALAALVLMLVVYFIPHSVLGSELDYTQLGE